MEKHSVLVMLLVGIADRRRHFENRSNATHRCIERKKVEKKTATTHYAARLNSMVYKGEELNKFCSASFICYLGP